MRARLAALVGVLGLVTLAGCSEDLRPRRTTTVTSVTTATVLPPATATSEPAEDPDASDASDAGDDPITDPGIETSATAGVAARLPWARVTCPTATVRVSTAEELDRALEAATPGTVVALADGSYEGAFVARTSGTPDRPIWLCGGRGAVLRGEGPRSGYVVHLDRATHWRLVGFTVTQGQKGVMADGTVGSVVQDLAVHDIGDEAIHLRRTSTDNLVIGNEISRTGLRRDKFGEGIYVGSAISNWCTISSCRPDRSDRNVIAENRISATTSEAVDIKEGTTGGLLVGNRFDGAGTTAADSWVDVKGTAWSIRGNTGVAAPHDGFQTHEIEDGWGERNVFAANTASAAGGGRAEKTASDTQYAFAFRPAGDNVVLCDNRASGLVLATQPCAPTTN